MKKIFAALLVSMMLTTVAQAGEVEVIGKGVDTNSAVRNALRAAIERELGLIVDSKTRTKNHQLIETEIRTDSNGFVENYEIISEQQLNGIYEVVVRANVQSDRLRSAIMSKLQKKSLIETTMGDPRILVRAVDESGRDLFDVENEFIAAFKSQGFSRLIDGAKADRADFIAKIVVNEKTISARLVGVTGGEVLCTENFEIQQRMFTDTRQWALQNAARYLAQAALEHAAQLERHVTVRIETPSVNRNELIERLKTLDGVNDVFVRSLIELDVNCDGTAADLAKLLEREGIVIRELGSELIKI